MQMSGMDRRQVLQSAAVLPFMAQAAMTHGEVTVFEAKRFITMEPAQPTARFAAVSGGMLLALADQLDELSAWTTGRSVKLDRSLAHNIVMPGLLDPHLHPMQAAVMLNVPFIAPDDWDLPSGNFPGARNPTQWWARLRHELDRSPDGPFICWGYHALFHGPLDRRALDEFAPDRAVVIWQRSFHDIIVNTATLKLWGLADQATFDAALAAGKALPADSSFERGLFSETGLMVALDKLRGLLLAPRRIQTGMAMLQRIFLTRGITTAADMGTGIFASFDIEAGLIRTAFERPDAASRIMLMPLAQQLAESADPARQVEQLRSRFAGTHVVMGRRVKLLADGAFFAQNMRMNAPGYSDGHSGKWITPPGTLGEWMARLWEAGLSQHIHVNGDEGLDVVLAAAEKLPVRRGQTITLEHLGYSTEAQNRRIARLGLMVSAQPNYVRVLGEAYARDGLGPDRAFAISRLGSLEAKGVPLGLHSDFNMAPIDPFYLAWEAASRTGLTGRVLGPTERISLAKALRAVTIEAAQVIGMDATVGSLAAGKRADFAVLDRDPLAGGVDGLRAVKIAGVVYDGRFIPA